MSLIVILAVALFLVAADGAARAQTGDVHVDLSDQRMVVARRGEVPASWPVSTARPGRVTPIGTFARR